MDTMIMESNYALFAIIHVLHVIIQVLFLVKHVIQIQIEMI